MCNYRVSEFFKLFSEAYSIKHASNLLTKETNTLQTELPVTSENSIEREHVDLSTLPKSLVYINRINFLPAQIFNKMIQHMKYCCAL
jgi:hypothetical protein